MRPLPELLKLPVEQLTKEEKAYVERYYNRKNYRHSASFVYHSRKLPEEPNANTD